MKSMTLESFTQPSEHTITDGLKEMECRPVVYPRAFSNASGSIPAMTTGLLRNSLQLSAGIVTVA